jgi:hypothetical protein
VSNFAELSNSVSAEGTGETSILHWRAQPAGACSATTHEQKLSTNEIGLLHETAGNGRRITTLK